MYEQRGAALVHRAPKCKILGKYYLFCIILSFVNLWFEAHFGLPSASWIKGNQLPCLLDSLGSLAAGRPGNWATVCKCCCVCVFLSQQWHKPLFWTPTLTTDEGKPHFLPLYHKLANQIHLLTSPLVLVPSIHFQAACPRSMLQWQKGKHQSRNAS